MASGGLQRPSKAGQGRNFFWLKRFLLTTASIPGGPWQCLAPQDPPAASRPSKAGRGRNFFCLKWFLVTSVWIPDGLWQCLWLFWYLVYCWTILGLYKVSTNKLGNLVMLVITTSFAFTNKPHGCLLHFWEPESLHNLYNVPSEPERAAEAREARRSCE